jgi:hypothetical protein
MLTAVSRAACCCCCCRWEAHEAEGYKWWAHRMARALQLYDETRIDHFRCAHFGSACIKT